MNEVPKGQQNREWAQVTWTWTKVLPLSSRPWVKDWPSRDQLLPVLHGETTLASNGACGVSRMVCVRCLRNGHHNNFCSMGQMWKSVSLFMAPSYRCCVISALSSHDSTHWSPNKLSIRLARLQTKWRGSRGGWRQQSEILQSNSESRHKSQRGEGKNSKSKVTWGHLVHGQTIDPSQ